MFIPYRSDEISTMAINPYSNKRSSVSSVSYPVKRQKKSGQPAMKIPRRLLPEIKLNIVDSATSFLTNQQASYDLPDNIVRGTASNDRIGSKIRISRIRVHFDYSGLTTLTSGVRMSLVIPKDPSVTALLSSQYASWDTQRFTVLYDTIMPNDPSCLAGIVEFASPLNVEYGGPQQPNGIQRNNVQLLLFAQANPNDAGSLLAANTNVSIYYTDA